MSVSSTGLSHYELHGQKPLTITVAMARRLSGLGITTIYALIKDRKLESTCIGRRRLIVYRSLENLLSVKSAFPGQPRRRGRPRKLPAPDGDSMSGSPVSTHALGGRCPDRTQPDRTLKRRKLETGP
jgi:hypothetical protein